MFSEVSFLRGGGFGSVRNENGFFFMILWKTMSGLASLAKRPTREFVVGLFSINSSWRFIGVRADDWCKVFPHQSHTADGASSVCPVSEAARAASQIDGDVT